MSNGQSTPMTEDAYQKAMEAIDEVLNDVDATPDQVDAAKAALDRVAAARIDFYQKNISDRTAFLTELSNQLAAVTASIQTNPVGDLLDKANGALAAVNDALAEG